MTLVDAAKIRSMLPGPWGQRSIACLTTVPERLAAAQAAFQPPTPFAATDRTARMARLRIAPHIRQTRACEA